jgi:putative ABC transport system permease protein
MSPGGVRERLARLLLGGFAPSEVEDVLRDLRELASDRPGLRREVYYWTELIKYPVRAAWERARHRGGPSEPGERGRGGMDGWWRDARHAARSLARSPGFTGMAIAIMTLSMGATTAIVSVVQGVLLDPLPIEEPERVVSIWLESINGGGRHRMTPGNFTDVESLEGVFTQVAAFQGRTASLLQEGEPVFLRGGAVTPAYFEVLGIRPVLGRAFRDEEGQNGGPPVVVLSHSLWTRAFGAGPDVVGQSIQLDGERFEVIGVAPPGLYPTQATVGAEIPFTASNQDFFVPLRYSSAGWANRRSHLLGMIGRLAPGVSPESVDAALRTLGARLRATEPLNANEDLLMTSFREEVVGDVRFALLTILATVGLVLLIAIVNVGALFVLRADDRQPEMAIRVALGAPRGRLMRQLALESALIATVASAGSIVVAAWAVDLMQGLVPYQIPRLADVVVDGHAVAAAGLIGLGIAAAFGLAPSFRLWSGRWAKVAGPQSQTVDGGQRRLQAVMVGVQACLGVVVLVGATLLARSYLGLRAVDLGFDAPETWVMSVPTTPQVLDEIVRSARALPGVRAAAVAYDHPLERNWGDGFTVEGLDMSELDSPPMSSLRPFGESYFDAAGIEVVEGRVPDAIDMAGEVAYAVINESLRDFYFPDGGAIGSHILLGTAQRMFGSDGIFEVLGVVEDVRFFGPDREPGPALYVPLSHFPVDATTLLVRPERTGLDVMSGVRRIVRDADPSLAVQRAQRLQDVQDDMLARPRFNMMLLVSFGVMGLILCGLGAYGLVGRVVVSRFKEIGIRLALGAGRPELAASVMRSALGPMLLGGVVGLAGSWALGRVIRSLLFGVSSEDPTSFVVSPLFVLLVGLAAALVPTIRALSIDPASTLRSE